MGLLAEVAVPDHQVLAESEIAPERSEREAEFPQIVEMLVLDQIVARQIPAPGEHDEGPACERRDPPTHEEPPAVHRALEVWIQGHREIPRQQNPAEHKREAEENGQLALQRMRRVQLSTLVTPAPPHSLAESPSPIRSPLGKDSNIEPYAGVDVPQAERRDDQEGENHPGEEERRIQPYPLLVDFRNVVRPPEDVMT